MVELKCYRCGGDRLARNGLTQNGKQRYLCSDCGRMSRDDPQANGYTEEERAQIQRAYHERSSLRGLSRTFGVSRNTVTSWLKEAVGSSLMSMRSSQTAAPVMVTRGLACTPAPAVV